MTKDWNARKELAEGNAAKRTRCQCYSAKGISKKRFTAGAEVEREESENLFEKYSPFHLLRSPRLSDPNGFLRLLVAVVRIKDIRVMSSRVSDAETFLCPSHPGADPYGRISPIRLLPLVMAMERRPGKSQVLADRTHDHRSTGECERRVSHLVDDRAFPLGSDLPSVTSAAAFGASSVLRPRPTAPSCAC